MKRKWTLKEKKKLFVVLIAGVLSGVLGYVESVIPPICAAYPYLRVQIAMALAFFALLCYSPAEAAMVYGVRCIVYGLVQNDGYAILFEWVAACLALVAIWTILRLRLFSTPLLGVALGVTYGLAYMCIASIALRHVALFAATAEILTFYAVGYLALGLIAYLMVRFIPEKLLFETDEDKRKK